MVDPPFDGATPGGGSGGGLPPGGLPEPLLELDDVFTALAHQRRRYLLDAFFADDVEHLDELAREIAARERAIPVDDVPAPDRDEVYASLYHAHVPCLVETGVCVFDESERVVEPGPNAESTLSLLHSAALGMEFGADDDSRSDRGD